MSSDSGDGRAESDSDHPAESGESGQGATGDGPSQRSAATRVWGRRRLVVALLAVIGGATGIGLLALPERRTHACSTAPGAVFVWSFEPETHRMTARHTSGDRLDADQLSLHIGTGESMRRVQASTLTTNSEIHRGDELTVRIRDDERGNRAFVMFTWGPDCTTQLSGFAIPG